MKTSAAYQSKSKEELLALLVEKDHHIIQQSHYIDTLSEMLRIHKYRMFGNKSEKLPINQLSIFNEAALPKKVDEIVQADEEIHIPAHTRKKKPGRKPLPESLPRKQVIHDLDESEKICACGCELTHIKDETSEQLEIIPAKVQVIQHIRKKYACKQCEDTIKTAPAPILPIPKSIASAGLLSHILVAKYQDHLPLYRQEKMLKRIGVDIPRSTLSFWVIKAAELLKPMMTILQQNIINYDVAYADETTTQVLKEPNKGIKSKKYMWLFAGGRPEQFCYYYHYHHSRSHDVPENFFEKYKGYVHCDGYKAYDTIAAKRPDEIELAGCLYHARRKFVEITKVTKTTEGVAGTVVKYIQELAKIEQDIKESSAAEKFRIRQEKTKLILEELEEYLIEKQPNILPKSPLGQAVSYTLNQWPKLLTHLKDGRLENNNNLSERAIKPFVMGRKGWLFSDSVAGAQAGAIIYSLIETCKHHNIEPYDWLRHALAQMPFCKTEEEISKLLPFNLDPKLIMPGG